MCCMRDKSWHDSEMMDEHIRVAHFSQIFLLLLLSQMLAIFCQMCTVTQ